MKNKRIVFGIIVLGALIALSSLISIYTDWVWFGSIGYLSVFSRILFYRVGVFLLGTVLVFGLIYLNLRYVKRYLGEGEFDFVLVIGALIFSLFVGLGFSGNWREIILFLNQQPFSVSDPVFGYNVGFYVFSLPFFSLLKNLLLIAVFLSGFFVFAKLFTSLSEEVNSVSKLPNKFISHLSVLSASFFGLLAIHFYLDRFNILYSNRGFVYGAGYTDINVVLPVIWIMLVLSIICALVSIYNIKNRSFRILPILVGLLLVVAFVGGSVLPGVVQSIQVNPSELSVEEPYIENNIEFTRRGFALNDVVENDFEANTNISLAELNNNQKTIENTRLWDYRALKTTYEQIQDIDRYTLNESNGYRQVMLSVREMDTSKLPPQARTWVNKHLVFTHGYGAVMSPVNEKTEEGAPELFLRDIPPTGKINLTRPEVYYGTQDSDYAVVDTDREEFDYPMGERNVYTSYKGSGGVELNLMNKLAYSYRFGSINLFLTDYINENSKIMINRDIRDRISNIAPFLELDEDPYAVVENGQIYWIMDAYTKTSRYPYSEPTNGINYIRNSVKVVVNAYSGEVDFYIADKDEPIINSWKSAFPDLFKDLEDMPSDLRQHIRYPEDYFSIQMKKYRSYHMQDPTVFYNQEDLWEIPREKYSNRRIPVEPYYVSISLPESNETEFMLIQPFTPSNRDNLIAWIGARSDEPNYGELLHYQFPKGNLIYGSSQIEARIDQDPTISQQLTLWDQRGSSVIRGNLLVIPLDDSLLYVEPVFIRSDEGSIPELRRVIVSNGNNVVMAETLDKGIDRLIGEAPGDGDIGDIESNIRQALRNYYNAINAQRSGNWSNYGGYLEELRESLENLNQTIQIPNEEK